MVLNFLKVDKGIYLIDHIIYDVIHKRFYIYSIVRLSNGKSIALKKEKKFKERIK